MTDVHPEGRPHSPGTYVKGCRCERCKTARREYQRAKYGHQPRPDTAAFIEDYLFLVGAGETHPEQLVARLGMTTVASLETRLRRYYGHYVAAGTLPAIAEAVYA